MEKLELGAGEAAVYMDREYASVGGAEELLGRVLEARPKALLGGEELYLTGPVQTVNLVTDRSITLNFALILPEELFGSCTQGEYGSCWTKAQWNMPALWLCSQT